MVILVSGLWVDIQNSVMPDSVFQADDVPQMIQASPVTVLNSLNAFHSATGLPTPVILSRSQKAISTAVHLEYRSQQLMIGHITGRRSSYAMGILDAKPVGDWQNY
jgi:hypothetical protein